MDDFISHLKPNNYPHFLRSCAGLNFHEITFIRQPAQQDKQEIQITAMAIFVLRDERGGNPRRLPQSEMQRSFHRVNNSFEIQPGQVRRFDLMCTAHACDKRGRLEKPTHPPGRWKVSHEIRKLIMLHQVFYVAS